MSNDERFIGKRLDGRYEISELIGVGGMAVVYKAYDSIDDRVVAIKILKEEFLANDEFRRRFKNESKAIAVLNHPNIVKVYDVSFGDVLQYIVMEYINGITLKDYIEQRGVIEWREATHFTTQVLRALQHAHEKGIVHRDIKPQNILLLPDGTIKVTDFGIARFSRSEQRTITDKAIGSVHYISPEQARGDFTDGKADIYSVGVLLYEMTTGRVPFQADSAVSVAIMQLQNEPVHPCEINSLIPRGLEEITLKAMKKDPNNRFATAQDMLDDIELVRDNPASVFNYEYFIDTAPTRSIPAQKSTASATRPRHEDTEEPKSNIIPILSGIAVVFVAVLVIAMVFIFRGCGTGETIECPNLVGLKYEDIKDDPEYSKYNIVINDESYEYNSEYDAGVIFRQSPEAKRAIKERSEITVYISQGAKEIKLNDYANYEFNTAKQELEDQGIKVNRVDIASADILKGYIISTNPAAGSIIKQGSEITAYVSSGEEAVDTVVPDVTGLTLDNAKKTIEASGFRVGATNYEYDDAIPSGIVISQSPEGRSTAALASSISVVVSRGPKPPETTTRAPETTKGATRVSISVPMPDYDTAAEMTVWVNGVQDSSQTVTLDLNQVKERGVSVSGTGTATLEIRLSTLKYKEYTVDFDEGTYTLLNTYDVSQLGGSSPTDA